ncbi:unnamed protein product [Pylaiella littoralis]
MDEKCDTFLWGGGGVANVDDVSGEFTCVCTGEGWTNCNILGQPSCVPTKAHVIFGALGVASSIVGICHAVHQLTRQINFHRQQVAALVSPREQARRHLHILVIAHDGIVLLYFIALLVLHGEQQWEPVILLCGICQITASIGGVMTLRMWIYTNDPRLMRETPEILAISDALESPVGQCTSYAVVCIGATVAVILAETNHPQAAAQVAAASFMCLIVGTNLIIWKCGTSLMGTIDKSLQRSAAGNSRPASPVSVTPGAEQRKHGDRDNAAAVAKNRVGGDPNLMVARKKIKMAMSFCLSMAVPTTILLVFAAGSTYGIAAPLLFFGIPMGLATIYWFILNIQLHAGRSKPPVSRGVHSPVRIGELENETASIGEKMMSILNNLTSRSPRGIVPTETPASP